MSTRTSNSLNSSGSGNRLEAQELSYGEMTTLSSGGILSKEMKFDIRKQNGYCLSCPLVPVLLIEIRRSRINPLWISKKPRTEEGECIEGRCLKCNPDRDRRNANGPAIVSTPSFRSSQSVASSISSCSLRSLNSNVATGCDQIISQRCSSKGLSETSQSKCKGILPPRPVRTSSYDSVPCSTSSDESTQQAFFDRMMSTSKIVKTNDASCSSRTEVTGNSLLSLASNKSNTGVEIHHPKVRYLAHQDGQFEHPSDAIQTALNISVHTEGTAKASAAIETVQSMPLAVDATSIETILGDLDTFDSELTQIEYLLSILDLNVSNEAIQHGCIEKINEFLDDGTIDMFSFIAAHGEWRIYDTIRNFPNSTKMQDCCFNILVALASSDNECSNAILADDNLCISVQQLLSLHIRELSLVIKAFAILRILSTEIEGRVQMKKLEVSKIIVSTMQYHMSSALIQTNGCAILSNMAVDVQRNNVSEVGNAELCAIVEAMTIHNNDETVIVSACFALKNFAFCPSNLRNMNRVPGIIDALEQASFFDAISISAHQTIEKLFLSRAHDESMVDQAQLELVTLFSEQLNDSEYILLVINKLEEFNWSRVIVAECFRHLKLFAMNANADMQELTSNVALSRLKQIAKEFPTVDVVEALSFLSTYYESN